MNYKTLLVWYEIQSSTGLGVTILLSIVFLFNNCNNNKDINYRIYSDANKKVLYGEGTLIDSLEEKHWTYYDENKNICEEGFYKKGMKKGIWNYNYDGIKFSINWKIFNSEKKHICINYPNDWDLISNDSVYFKLA